MIFMGIVAILFSVHYGVAACDPKRRAKLSRKGQEPVGSLTCAGLALGLAGIGALFILRGLLPGLHPAVFLLVWLAMMAGFIIGLIGRIRDGRGFRARQAGHENI